MRKDFAIAIEQKDEDRYALGITINHNSRYFLPSVTLDELIIIKNWLVKFTEERNK